MRKIAYIAGGSFTAVISAVILVSGAANANIYDHLEMTIDSSCEISRSSDSGSGHYVAIMSPDTTNSNIGTTKLEVTCNDAEGWRITAIGWYGSSSSTDLTHGSDGTITIPTGTSLTDSSWAMKLNPGTGVTLAGGFEADDFNDVPSSSTRIAYSETTAYETQALSITYQVHASSSQIAGTYNGGVKYTVAHPAAEPICGATMVMQDITSSYISSMTAESQVQMCDERDGKKYWVSKLADGNVWMTQNLDFDIDSTKTYTSADTNLSSNWTPSTSTYTTGTTTWNDSYTAPESYDPGDVCWNGNLNTDWDGTLDTETVACTSSNMNYHIGNYYNWTAAVAMNDSSSYEDDTIATQSICPAGWTLPLSGHEEIYSGSFVNLLYHQGEQTMWGAPLSFVLGGDWYGSSSSVASYGGYWSSVIYDSYNAYGLYFYSDGRVGPQDYGSRDYGFSVRCVITTSTASISSNDSSYGSVSSSSVTAIKGDSVSTSSNTITIGSTTVTATPNSGYRFDSWTNNCGSTITENCTITANFETDVTTFAQAYTAASKTQYSGYYQMHEMTTSICSAVSSGQSAQLIDRRDSKVYWVTKLADGDCWMTQNLDFNINDTTKTYLTSTYTDRSSTWSPSSTYYTKTTISSSSNNSHFYSWDLGDYYYVPSGNTSWTSCGTSATSYSSCTSYGFSTTKPTADAKGKTLTSVEAEHYQVGTLYQWCAATAGTCSNATSSGAIAPGSICPKGWRLPYSGNNTTTKGFGYLLNQSAYNLISSYDKLKISADPLYFVPGGVVNSGTLPGAGGYGFYWSSRAYSSTKAYYLNFDSSAVSPSSYNYRYYGHSVRCVAR